MNKKIKEVCIIGCGTYGSYIAKKLSKFDVKITIIDVGNSKIKSEQEIGYNSNLLSSNYEGLSKGRFFGLGGTSSKWGGQLLFFSEKDFSQPTPFLKSIVNLNIKHKDKVLKNFGVSDYVEDQIFNDDFFIKSGIWLSYFKRNLFKYFKIKKQNNVKIIPNSRVIKIEFENNKSVNRITYLSNGIEKFLTADYFYLTTGAFESSRLLLCSGGIKEKNLKFSDHYSKKFVKINGSPNINNIDFTFKFNKDFSLRTTRLVGELTNNNLSYFVHPIYNSEFDFFQNFKTILFKKKYDIKIIFNIIKDLPSVFKFIYFLTFLKKLFIKNDTWYLQIDIEGHIEDSDFMLSNKLDKFNQNGIDINVISVDKLKSSFLEIENKILNLLKINNIKYEICENDILINKIEDTYHPYRIMSNFGDIDDYYNHFNNMLVVNTGILPRVGGINPTASLFPIIEQHILDNFEQV